MYRVTSLSEAALDLPCEGCPVRQLSKMIGEAEQAAHHAQFRVLGRAAEKIIVVEVEVDDLAVAVDRDAGDVVAEIAVPIDAGAIRIVDHVAAISYRRLGGCAGLTGSVCLARQG